MGIGLRDGDEGIEARRPRKEPFGRVGRTGLGDERRLRGEEEAVRNQDEGGGSQEKERIGQDGGLQQGDVEVVPDFAVNIE